MAEGVTVPVTCWFFNKWKSVSWCFPAEAAAHPVGPALKAHSIQPKEQYRTEPRVETGALHDRRQRNDSLIDGEEKKSITLQTTKTTGMKKTKKKCSGDFRGRGPHLKCTCLWGSGGQLGAIFFYCFVICNATKNVHGNYKQTKSIKRKKKEKRKHPLAVCWAVRYIVRYECTRDIWNTTKPPCTLFSLLQKTFLYGVVLHFFSFFLNLSFFAVTKRVWGKGFYLCNVH